LATLLIGAGSFFCKGEGIPEPSLVMYGLVTDAQGMRQTNGTLVVTILRPNGGPALRLESQLADINGQYSYILLIPCETELPGFPVTAPDRLKLGSVPVGYDRSAVTFNGTPIRHTNPDLALLQLTSKDRGRFDRVDFAPEGASDLDSNGLLKSWELKYFGRLGVDPQADPDGDGMSNRDEMLAGTNATDSQSRLAFVAVTALPSGGARVAWSSEPGRSYGVLRSSDLRSGFVPIGLPQAANPPANTFVDTAVIGDGSYFCRIKIITP
jgi:hypothetical protein